MLEKREVLYKQRHLSVHFVLEYKTVRRPYILADSLKSDRTQRNSTWLQYIVVSTYKQYFVIFNATWKITRRGERYRSPNIVPVGSSRAMGL